MDGIEKIDLISESERYLIDYSNIKSKIFTQDNFLNKESLYDFYRDPSKGVPLLLPVKLDCFDYSQVNEIFDININEFARYIFSTKNTDYVGVKKYFQFGNRFCIGAFPKKNYTKRIKQFNEINSKLKKFNNELKINKKKVIAFQTRNIPHLGHEKIIEMLLEEYDYVIINPVIGPKKKGDVKNHVLVKVFNFLSENYYNKKIIFMPVCANMFYAGPREALHHACLRSSVGFDSFVVGRDHAGAENNYNPEEAINVVKKYESKFNIRIITHKGSYFDKSQNKIVIKDNLNKNNNLLNISGSDFRNAIIKKKYFKFARKDLQEFIYSFKHNIFY